MNKSAKLEAWLEITLLPAAQSSGIARTFVRHHLISLGFPELVEDGCLIAAELVTNAMKGVPDQPCRLHVVPNGGCPVIEVWDRSPEPPVRMSGDPYATSGRGLLITAALSAAWGHYCPGPERGGGKVVWARLR